MNERYFEVGMTVYSVRFGEGRVIEIKNNYPFEYPVLVKFASGEYTFTNDGRLSIKNNIELFQEPITVPVNKPLINLKKGDRVWVKTIGNIGWDCAYFSHYDSTLNLYHCFEKQKKDGFTSAHNECREFNNIPF
jgi:hypothetical protein